MPPLRFFHRLIGAAEEPAPVYYIRGTSTNVGGTETFNIQFILDGQLTPETAETITCAVDSSGNWEYQYSGKKIYSTYDFANSSTLLSVIFDDADDFSSAIYVSIQETPMFTNCTNLTNVSFANQLFDNTLRVGSLFANCVSLTNVNLHNATFTNVVSLASMFRGCIALLSVDLSSATFTAATNAEYMFYNCSQLATLAMPSAIFGNVTNIANMFNLCSSLVSLNLGNADFSKVSNSGTFIRQCTSLTTLTISITDTFGAPTSDTPFRISESNLTYQSFLNIANWLKAKIGRTANLTIKTSAWNALSAAEQATITGIVTSKNWNLVTA